MPTVSDPDNKGEWLVQRTLANITGDHSPPPAGITYASVPPGQACELREHGSLGPNGGLCLDRCLPSSFSSECSIASRIRFASRP